LDEIPTKVLKVFFLAIHSHLYSFEFSISKKPRNLLCISSNSRNLLCISKVKLLYKGKQKGGKSVLGNPCRYPNSKNSQDYAQKPQPQTSTSIVRSASGHKILQNSITNAVCKQSLPEVALTFFQVFVVVFIQTESFWLLVLCKCQEKYSYFL
jgi:hypothetical protein